MTKKNEELSQKAMIDMLVELSNSNFWPAIKQYSRERDAIVMQSLRTIDPVKEPAQMARIQGVSSGLFDLETAILMETQRREEANKKATEDKTKSDKK